jgi:DNA-binding transcriptional LysR family regulator
MKKTKSNGHGAGAHPEETVLSMLAKNAPRTTLVNTPSTKDKPTRSTAATMVSWSPGPSETVPEQLLAFIDETITRHGREKNALWGMIGPEFRTRTALTAPDLQREVAARAGYDLYVCSPGPDIEALYPNLWSHLAVAIPKSQPILKSLLKTCEWPAETLSTIEPSVTFSTSHYYTGNARFWGQYHAFLNQIVADIRSRGTKTATRFLNQATAATAGTGAIAHWRLLIDRLLPTFLRQHGAGLKVARIPITAAEQKMNTHLRRLREMKDVAHHTKSKWLASCWLHYRNTYLLNIAGRDWCQRNLPLMTPTDIRFY